MRNILKLAVVVIVSLIFSQCSSSEQGADAFKTIGSRANKSMISEKLLFTPENYNLEALDILERGKQRIQDTLPVLIQSQLGFYMQIVKEYSKQPVLSYSLSETERKNQEVQLEMTLRMLENEIAVNTIYYEIANELTLLNYRYNHFYEAEGKHFQLLDYYEVSPFVLGEDVARKFQEFHSEVRERKNSEIAVDGTIQILSMIPFAKGLKVIRPGISAYKAVTTGNATAKSFSLLSMNQSLRASLSERYTQVKSQLTSENFIALGAKGNLGQILRTKEQVEEIQSNVVDRIGDFSDGIVTQPIGNLRKIIEKNTKELSEIDNFPIQSTSNL